MKEQTLWQRGSRLLFGQMYEDVEIEMRAFPPGSRLFSIASAGCSAIALSQMHKVTAVDINPIQLEYARLRAWGAPAERGVAERAMQMGRRLMAVGGWTPASLEQFVELSDCSEQLDFWNGRLNRPLFRTLFDTLISSALLAVRYCAPDQTFLPKLRFGPFLRKRLERGFARYPNCRNPYARRLVAGHLTENQGRFGRQIRFEHADAAGFLEACPAASFDAFSLSNIVDGVTQEYSRRLFAAIRHAGSPDAVAVLRSFRESDNPTASEMAAQDRAMIWGSIYVCPARFLSDALLA